MTASVIFSPSFASASALSLPRIIAEISSGRYHLSPILTSMPPFSCLLHLERHDALSFWTPLVEAVADEALDLIDGVLRVRDRLALREGADDALAVLPDRDDGGRRALRPSAFSRTRGSPPSTIAIAELVVPKSIPRIFAIAVTVPSSSLFFTWSWPRAS
jgi:hypothetical protein